MNGRYCRRCRAYHPMYQQAAPYKASWRDHAKDGGEIVLGVVVFLALFFGIPFLLWLGWST